MRHALFAASLILCPALWVITTSAFAADEPAKPIELTISGQAIEQPLLKYRLLPTDPQLKAGDAAPILLRLVWDETEYFAKVVPTFEKWATKPLDDPEWKEAKPVLNGFFEEMKRAAYRRDAAWEFPIREQHYHNIILPDVQSLCHRLIGEGLTARTRFYLTRRDLPQARDTLSVGLADLRHVAQSPFVVVQLIAASGARSLLGCIDEMVGVPESPNLYWALATLPRPMFDLRPSAELEQVSLQLDIPGLKDLDRPRSSDDWKVLFDLLMADILNSAAVQPGEKPALKREMFLQQAKDHRSQWGNTLPADLTDDEAIVRFYVWLHTRHVQRAAALACLPPPQAIPALRQLDRQAREDFEKLGIPIQATPHIALVNLDICLWTWNVDRKIAALGVVEAIRDFVASHAGKLPDKLSDVTAVNLPVDPLTGQPFQWSLEDNVGRLSAATIDGSGYSFFSPTLSLEYVLRVR